MPNQPATPGRYMRIPDEEWEPTLRITADRGETATDVVRRALRRYIREFGTEDDRLALTRMDDLLPLLVTRLRKARSTDALADREDLALLVEELLQVVAELNARD